MTRPGCPSCDHDLSYPGKPGHECYTYEEWRARQAPTHVNGPHPEHTGQGPGRLVRRRP